MHILRKNTTPQFEIVPRKALETTKAYFLHLKNEYTIELQTIECVVELLENENYNMILLRFPNGKINEKFSFELKEEITNDLVLIGQLMIVDENEVVQDYSKKTNNKFYQ